jgi:hypothetical protein
MNVRKQLERLSPGKPFQPNIIFVGNAKRGSSRNVLHWFARALPENIRVGWNVLPGTNTLAYNENL